MSKAQVEQDKSSLWEILVPTMHPETAEFPKERPIRKRFHQVWDEYVRAISGGLTIMSPSKGQWVSPHGRLFVERMIPVRILATRAQIETIIDHTMRYYNQEAVLCYRVSDDVILKHRSA